ncbi:MAG: RNA polymerase sigma factor [Aggregatilineales bacterium]
MIDREHALLEDAQAGDMDAYEELQILLTPDVRRFVRRLIQHTETEDDLMQDIFLRFYLNLDKIDPVEKLRPYLFRIARNRCYDDLRRLGRYDSQVSLDDEPVEMRVSFQQHARQPKPDDMAHWMLLHLEIQDAMQQLPESQRQTLILYSEEQMSYAEIADITDVSIGTVKSRLYYAKKNLRGYLNPDTLSLIDNEFGDDKPKKRKQKKEKQPMEAL